MQLEASQMKQISMICKMHKKTSNRKCFSALLKRFRKSSFLVREKGTGLMHKYYPVYPSMRVVSAWEQLTLRWEIPADNGTFYGHNLRQPIKINPTIRFSAQFSADVLWKSKFPPTFECFEEKLLGYSR